MKGYVGSKGWDCYLRYMKTYKREEEILNKCIDLNENGASKQFVRKMNPDMSAITLFWKAMSKVNGWCIENCNKIRDGTGRLPVGKDDMKKTWEK